MYHVSVQRTDKHIINVHYYLCDVFQLLWIYHFVTENLQCDEICAYMHPSGIVIKCLPPSVQMCTFASNGKALSLRL